MSYRSGQAIGTIYCVFDDDGNIIGLSHIEFDRADVDPPFDDVAFDRTCLNIDNAIRNEQWRNEQVKDDKRND